MKIVKQTAEYTIYQKRNQRYGVKGADRKWINADEKVKVLLAEGLIKVSEPTAPAEEPVEESADAAAEEAQAAETSAEETEAASDESEEAAEKPAE